MIDAIDLAGFLKALRKRVNEDPEIMRDSLTLISNACIADGEEANLMEISKTLIEIVYPETLGQLRSLTCSSCHAIMAPSDEEGPKTGKCVDCRIKFPGENP